MNTIRSKGQMLSLDEARENGFTLIELMIVILIIAILVAIAIPLFMSLSDRASRNTAQANRRIGTQALTYVYLNDIEGKGGGPAYVDPTTGVPMDAAFLRAKEPKIK